MPDAGGPALPAISIVRGEAAPHTEEDSMYPYISRAMAQERARDLQNDAIRAHRARQLRLVRRARREQDNALANVQIPDSYEDFLCQTAESAMREPTATGRASGQAIR
jgi:hypothetical protein